MICLLTLSVFAASESGSLGSRGSYSFSCDNGNIFSKYVDASSSASYNGNTSVSTGSSTRYSFTDGRAKVEVTLDDGTNNQNYDDFTGTDYSGDAYVKVYGRNDGSAYCYARVSGVLLFDDGTYSDTNQIEVSSLNP